MEKGVNNWMGAKVSATERWKRERYVVLFFLISTALQKGRRRGGVW